MARNVERRTLLSDAAVRVLAQQGARGLTHRAVDTEAGVPPGTVSNYFATRDAIIDSILERISDRLAPSVEDVAAKPRTNAREAFAYYLRDIVRRLTTDKDAAVALFELRLEATRRPHVANILTQWLRDGLDADVAFNERQELPGGRDDIVIFHYAITGFILDQITIPIDSTVNTDETIDRLVASLLPVAPTPSG